jgi:hypothetical protein
MLSVESSQRRLLYITTGKTTYRINRTADFNAGYIIGFRSISLVCVFEEIEGTFIKHISRRH